MPNALMAARIECPTTAKVYDFYVAHCNEIRDKDICGSITESRIDYGKKEQTVSETFPCYWAGDVAWKGCQSTKTIASWVVRE